MNPERTVVIARMIRGAIERRQWRSETEREVWAFAWRQGAARAELERLMIEVRRQYDEAGAGFSGRFQGVRHDD